jgi:hypothetical protein
MITVNPKKKTATILESQVDVKPFDLRTAINLDETDGKVVQQVPIIIDFINRKCLKEGSPEIDPEAFIDAFESVEAYNEFLNDWGEAARGN